MAIKITVCDGNTVLYQSDPQTFTRIEEVLRNVTNAIEGGSERAKEIRQKFNGCVCPTAENHDGVCHGVDCYCH